MRAHKGAAFSNASSRMNRRAVSRSFFKSSGEVLSVWADDADLAAFRDRGALFDFSFAIVASNADRCLMLFVKDPRVRQRDIQYNL